MDPKSSPDLTPPATPAVAPAILPPLDLPADVAVEDADEIRAYLAQYPELMPVLRGLCREARRQLGDETALIVRINRDPEVHDPYVKIIARMPAYDAAAWDRLVQVREGFHPALEASDGWLHLSTDFGRPRGHDGV